MIETLMALAAENGFSHWAAADMSALTPRQDVRDMCCADRCGRWNASWSCPPACGTLEQTAADIRRFDAGLVVQTTGALADEFDYAAMEDIQRRHKRSFESFARQVRLLTGECLPLSAAVPIRTDPAAFRSGGWRPWRPTACWCRTCASAPGWGITTERAP